MLVAVLGSTGRIGSAVVDEAARRGWDVRAAVRPGTTFRRRPHVAPWPTDLEDQAAFEGLVSEADAVIAALGPRANRRDQVPLFEGAATRLVGSMERQRVGRLVVLSGAGVRVEGDRRGPFDALMLRVAGTMARWVVAAKQVETEVIARSDLAWTALRPPIVVDGPRTGAWELAEAAPGFGARITRADVAAALLEQATEETWLRRAPFVWTPNSRRREPEGSRRP